MISPLLGLIRLPLIGLAITAIGCGQAAPPPPAAPASGINPGPPTAFQKVPKK